MPDDMVDDSAGELLEPFLVPGETLQWARQVRADSATLHFGSVRPQDLLVDLSVGVTAGRMLAVKPRRLRKPKGPAFAVERDGLALRPTEIAILGNGVELGSVIGLVVPTGTRSMGIDMAFILLLGHYRDRGVTAGAVEELLAVLGREQGGSIGRRMFNESRGAGYEALGSLEDARAHPDGALVLEGDYGGQIYLTCPASVVECSESTLAALLRELDRIAWPTNDNDGIAMHFEVAPVGAGIAGGIGGGIVTESVWVHDEFHRLQLAEEIRDVVLGLKPSFKGPDATPGPRTDGSYFSEASLGWRLRFGPEGRLERETGELGTWAKADDPVLMLHFRDRTVPALFVGGELLVAPDGDPEDPTAAAYLDFEFSPDAQP
jgi:hypothetical protein